MLTLREVIVKCHPLAELLTWTWHYLGRVCEYTMSPCSHINTHSSHSRLVWRLETLQIDLLYNSVKPSEVCFLHLLMTAESWNWPSLSCFVLSVGEEWGVQSDPARVLPTSRSSLSVIALGTTNHSVSFIRYNCGLGVSDGCWCNVTMLRHLLTNGPIYFAS